MSHRNGYEPRRVVTTAGPVELERPRVRNARELGFESRILGRHVARTYALESLIICSFLRGLSVRDVEAALEETFEEPVIGKSTVARVCQDTRERYRRWCERRLDEHDLVYLFLRRAVSEAAPRRRAGRGRAGRLGRDAGGPQGAARAGAGQPRELRELARVRARPRRPRAEGAGADRRRRRARAVEGRARAVADAPRNSAVRCTRSATSPASCPSATTASSRRAGGRSSTTPPQRPTRAAA